MRTWNRALLRVVAVAVLAVLGGGVAAGAAQPYEGLEPRVLVPGIASDRPLRQAEIDLAAAETAWAAAGFTDYRMALVISQYGPLEHYEITVEDGVPTEFVAICTVGDQTIACPEVDPAVYTIDGLLAMIRHLLTIVPQVEDPDAPPGQRFLEATYVAPHGLPIRIHTGLRNVFDSDRAYEIMAFELLDPAQDLAAAKARWAANAWYEYAMRVMFWAEVQGTGFSLGADVLDGAILILEADCYDSPDALPRPCEPPDPMLATVPGLLAFLEARLADGTLRTASYDVRDGHPLRATWEPANPADADQFAIGQFDPLH